MDSSGELAADDMAESHGQFSATHSRPRLERRLASLRALEWFNVVWLALILLWWLPVNSGQPIPDGVWQRMVAYLPVAWMLLIGGWYWHRKLHQLRWQRPLGDALRILDRFARVLPWTLAVASAALLWSWISRTGYTTDRVWATGMLVFAWLEYINYFKLQLMHDTRSDLRRLRRTRRLRQSWLARELAARRAGPSDEWV